MATQSVVELVCQAIADLLAGGTYSQTVQVRRSYLREVKVAEITDGVITVAPGQWRTEFAGRGLKQYRVVADVALHARVQSGATSEVDPWVGVMQEIVDRLGQNRRLPTYTDASLGRIEVNGPDDQLLIRAQTIAIVAECEYWLPAVAL